MKVFKVIVFLAIVIYWISSMNSEIKGEGIFGSLLGIIVLGIFIYGAFYVFFKHNSDKD